MIAALKHHARRFALRKLKTVTGFQTDEPVIALTFDDGPDPTFTPRVLDLLAKHDAKATFFVVGQSAVMHRDVIERIADAGHAIANHTHSHVSMVGVDAAERQRQIDACEQAIAPWSCRLFRPPWGHQDIASCRQTVGRGLQVVCWGLEVQDYSYADPKVMADQLVEGAVPGSIVLLHDAIHHDAVPGVNTDRSDMLESLDEYLTRVGDRFTFVTLPRMFEIAHPIRRHWFHQPD